MPSAAAFLDAPETPAPSAASFLDAPDEPPIPEVHPDHQTFLAMADAHLQRNLARIQSDPALTPEQKAAGVAHYQDATDRMLASSGFDPELRKQSQLEQGKAALAGVLRTGTGVATGSMLADTTVAVGAALGMSNPVGLGALALIAGGAGFFGGDAITKKALDESARDNDPVLGPLGKAARAHPDTEATGALAGALLPVPGSLGKLADAAGIVQAERGTAAAAKFVARQMAAGAAVGVGTDALVRGAGQAFGMPDSELSPQSSGFAATLGALLSGHGVRFRDYTSPEVADIMTRGMTDEAAARATPDGGVVPPSKLKPEEEKVYMAVRDQLAAITLSKPNGAKFDPTGAEFTARQVGGAGGGAVRAESAVPMSAAEFLDGPAGSPGEHSLVQAGAPTVVLGTKGAEFPAVYAFAPTRAIQTSHAGEMLAPNPAYALTNTRDYSDPAERDKQLDVLANFDPRRHVTDAPDAAVGPSIVGTVIDENGVASLQRFGGNSRGYAIANLPPDRRAGLRAVEDAKARQFGLKPATDPDAELIRYLGTFDFRQSGARERAQGMVDALNPSPGRQQSTAERAQIDAATVPAEGLAQVPMEISPKDAQAFVSALIAAGHVDRNLTSGIAAAPSQAQDYTQRLLVNAAFRQPAIAEARRDPRAAGTTVRGLIDAAVPALLQLRAKGGSPIADAITQAFTTTLGYVREDGGGLTDALDKAAQQTELSPEHEAARAVAIAMRAALVTDKAGKPLPDQSSANARTLFANLASALAQHDPSVNLFGQSESLVDVVKRAALSPVVRAAQAKDVPAPVRQFAAQLRDPAKVVGRLTHASGLVIVSADDLVSPAVKAAGVNEGPAVYALLKPVADVAREKVFDHLIDRTPSGSGHVVLMAGGPGSGKSTQAQSQTDAEFVYDSILGNPETARDKIARILATGRTAEVLLVVRDPAEAMRANLERALSEMRVASASGLAEAHVNARRTAKLMAAEFPQVPVRVIETVGGGRSREIPLASVADLSLDQTAAAAHRVLDEIANGTDPGWKHGRLPPGILAAARSGAREAPQDIGSGDRGGESQGAAGGTAGRPVAQADPGSLGTPDLGRAGAAPTALPMALEGSGTVSIPQVLDSFAKIVVAIGGDAPIRFGHFFKKALGIYKVGPRVIRIGNAGDLATGAHEVSHALQHVAFKDWTSAVLVRATPAPVSFELRKLGVALYGPKMPAAGYEAEGLAEFVRLYLTDDTAKATAPHTFDWFVNDFLAKQPPALRAAVAQAKAMADLWRSQGAMARAKAQMPLPPGRLAQLAARVRGIFTSENWIEEFAPLKELADEYRRETGRTLKPASSPYDVASARRGTSGAVTLQMVLHGMIDLQGNLALDASGRPIGSLREILAPVRGLEDETWAYLWARRAVELHASGRDPGMALADAQHLIAKLETAHPDLAPAAQRIYAWQNAVLEYLRQGNPALSESIDRIQASSQNYVPLGRVIESTAARSAVQRLTANPLARLKGSGRQVKPMGDQIIANTQKLVAMAHKSQVLATIVKLAQTPGLGHIIEQVPKDRVKQSLNFDQIRAQLEAMGVDTSAIGPDELVDFYTVAETPKGIDPIIPVRLGSEVKWYQVSPELFELLSGLEPARLGPLADLFLGVPARIFRLGTTGLRASFNYITNPTRDLQTLLVQSQGSDNPARILAAYLAALKDVVVSGLGSTMGATPSPFVAMFQQLGTEAGQPFGIEINHTRVAAKGLFQTGFRQLATSPASYFRALLNFMESVPRVAELRLVANKIGYVWGTPMTPDQATALALAAKRVTTDFSAGGKLAKMFNQGIPFFNANVQGARTAARTLKNRPWVTALKALQFAALGLALWWKHKDDPHYINLPWRERLTYWNFITADGNVVQIPKTQEWGQVAVLTEAFADAWYRKDARAITEAAGHIFKTLNPLDYPVVLRMAKEQWENRISYFDKPIVPRNQIDLPPGEQSAVYTSELAKALGRAFPDTLSPRRIDAAVRSTLGGAGGDALEFGDRLVQALGLMPAPDRRDGELSDLPILGRVFRRGGVSSAQSQALADFWDVYLAMEARSKSKTFPLKPTEELYFKWLDQRNSNQSGNEHGPGPKDQIKTLDAIANATQDPTARQRLYDTMSQIARSAIDRRPKP